VENGDVAIGGAGADTIQADFDRAAGGVRVNVFRDGSVLTSEATAVSAMGVETIFGMAGDDWIDASRLGTDEGLEVYGQGGSDTFVNGAGKDSFFGGAGTDTIVYSGPSSNYLVQAIGPLGDEFTIQDRTTGVIDDIHGVERVRFGDTETAATGFITTSQSFDGTTQWGGTIVGGSGIDTISYANANSAIYVDLMREGGYAQALNAQQWDQHVTAVENLTGATNFINYMMGDNRDNVLTGGDNLDWLAGRGGSNTLDGRGGYDIVDYYEMTEAVSIDLTTGKAVHSTGTDTLISIDEFRGTNRADTFVGDALNNYFSGMGGNDIARGGGGADTLVGYDGDDIFYGEEGDDALSGEADNDTLYGGAGNDTLDGGAGNDTLSGGSGQNTLTGGLGDDVYLVDSAADVIVETVGQGSDRVVTSVSYTLSAGAEIEAFSAAAGTTALNLTGNEFANAITGNGGANMINGGLGRDVLTGLGGSDSFAFNTALGANNIDTIADYAKGERILLDDAIFTRVGAVGQLTGAAFYSGTAAHDADDRVIYNAKTGALFYDADGTGATAAVQFATVTGQPALHAADFWVI
jgi:Ca2+-binding RTX toxin-like protein